MSVFANSSEKKDNELMNESLEALFHCDIFFREKWKLKYVHFIIQKVHLNNSLKSFKNLIVK